jgi:hypothetical protein
MFLVEHAVLSFSVLYIDNSSFYSFHLPICILFSFQFVSYSPSNLFPSLFSSSLINSLIFDGRLDTIYPVSTKLEDHTNYLITTARSTASHDKHLHPISTCIHMSSTPKENEKTSLLSLLPKQENWIHQTKSTKEE